MSSATLVPPDAGVAEPAVAADLAAVGRPEGNVLHRFGWKYRDEKGDAGGRGAVRIASPDTLRFDVAGPLGSGKAAALVVGDSAEWVQPEDAVKKLVPNYPLLWGMFGVARPPLAGATVRVTRSEGRVAWQYALGADTVEYERTLGPKPTLVTVVREGGRLVGRARVDLAPDSGHPRKARLDVPSVPARLDLTFTQSSTPDAFKPDTWAPLEP